MQPSSGGFSHFKDVSFYIVNLKVTIRFYMMSFSENRVPTFLVSIIVSSFGV